MDRSAYDRFDSREPEIKWNKEAESQGREARLLGFQQNDPAANPYHELGSGHWLYQSFAAGWCDTDMDMMNGIVTAEPFRN
jgi:hypothetical protein